MTVVSDLPTKVVTMVNESSEHHLSDQGVVQKGLHPVQSFKFSFGGCQVQGEIIPQRAIQTLVIANLCHDFGLGTGMDFKC